MKSFFFFIQEYLMLFNTATGQLIDESIFGLKNRF